MALIRAVDIPAWALRAGSLALCLLLAGCFQAQLLGPVAGSEIRLTELRSDAVLYDSTQVLTLADNEALFGEKWSGFSAFQRQWLLGIFQLDSADLVDDRLYLLSASGGTEHAMSAGSGALGETAVSGEWHAIISGAQLKERGPKVSLLTEVAYQWLAPQLEKLSDAQVLRNLDTLAGNLTDNVDDDPALNNTDLLAWSVLFNQSQLRVPVTSLEELALLLQSGAADSEKRSLIAELVSLEVDQSAVDLAAQDARTSLSGLQIDEFFERSFELLMSRHPQWVSELGLDAEHDFPLTLNEVADYAEQETFSVVAVILELLREYDSRQLSESQRISLQVYEWYLEDWLAREPWLLYNYPASAFITGIPRKAEFFFSDILLLETADDVRHYVARLGEVGRQITQVREMVSARAELGIIEPSMTFAQGVQLVRAIARTRATSTSYYRRLDETIDAIPGLDAQERGRLRQQAQDHLNDRVIPAYNELYDELLALEDRAPDTIGFSRFPGGRDFYAYSLRHFTTLEDSAEAIHDAGQSEVDRVQAEIRELASQLGYASSLTLTELFAQLAEDGGSYTGDDIVSTYEAILANVETRLPELFGLIPEQELVIIGGQRGGVYLGGTEDGRRPGAFYASNVGVEPYYSMPPLAYHEGLPGHHMQIALGLELDLPDFRRFARFTGFTEGWALYAERLASEQGWYEDDLYGELGRAQFELIRAVRMVVDTGIHDQGWSWQQAVDYYAENAGVSEASAQGNTARFMRWPGQGPAYMAGMLEILALRDAAAEAAGFDLREFHDLVLGGSAMPLPILREVVEAR